ncbi:hypothetical protein BD311DRAFT_490964 [Dichomitus squalens]|uniref:Uncharacterized protein n=1 Tax=Dichomitus squalens TaxID=114155 RepID=A0A4Q9MEG8_9APHY|nr:hypothetical protein BD311DRAFT_490964 [Dichomitus squalens]
MTWLLKTVPTQFQRGCPSADRYEVACKKTPCLACLRHSGVMRPRRPQARSSSHSLLAIWRLLSITIRPIYTEDSASQEYKATLGAFSATFRPLRPRNTMLAILLVSGLLLRQTVLARKSSNLQRELLQRSANATIPSLNVSSCPVNVGTHVP